MSLRKTIAFAFSIALVLNFLSGSDLYAQSGMPQEPPLAGIFEERNLIFEAQERQYSIYIPAQLAATPALLFAMHGAGSKAKTIRAGTNFEFDQLAEEHGFLVVYPSGFEDHWNDCRRGLADTTDALNVNDVGYLATVRDRLVSQYNVDLSRIFALGMSNGGHMAYRLAVESPDDYAAIAVIAASLPTEDKFQCESVGHPISIMILTGTTDPINPYEGGMVNIFGQEERGTVRSARDSADYFSQLAGYADEPLVVAYPDLNTQDKSTASALVWQADGQASVRFVTLEGAGHSIPHPTRKFPPFFGGTNGDINAVQEIWRFFETAVE